MDVRFDADSQSYIATCDDFQPYLGIATEGETSEELKKKLSGLFQGALFEAFKKPERNKVILTFDLVNLPR